MPLAIIEHFHIHFSANSNLSKGSKLIIKLMPAEISAAGFALTDEWGNYVAMDWSFLLKVVNPSPKPVVIKDIYTKSEGKGGSLRSEKEDADVYEIDPAKPRLKDKRPLEADYSTALPLLVEPHSSILIRVHIYEYTYKKLLGIFRKAEIVKKETSRNTEVLQKYRMRDTIYIRTNVGKAVIRTVLPWRMGKLTRVFNKLTKVQVLGGQ